MTSLEQFEYLEVIKQVDAISSFEGFSPTDLRRATNEAIMSGRVTHDQVAKEMCEFAAEHKTIDGFAATRAWL